MTQTQSKCEKLKAHFKALVLIVGFVASLITIATFTPTILTLFPSSTTTTIYSASTTSISITSLSVTSSSSFLPTNPSINLFVTPEFGYLPSNGVLAALIPDNQSVSFALEFNNTGSSQVDFVCCYVDIQFPYNLHSAVDMGLLGQVVLSPRTMTNSSWVYGTNLPRYPGFHATLTFTFYSSDGSWQNSKPITVWFT
jgi:hypothetical protein